MLYDSLQALKPTLLWENPNPTSAFSAQTITLNSDDYDFLELYFKTGASHNTVAYVKAEKGVGLYLVM